MMVAFNFKQRFVPAILAGTKFQTIRKVRQSVPAVGAKLQLYTGQRTAATVLIGRAKLASVEPVWIVVDPNPPYEATGIAVHDQNGSMGPDALLRLAKADGFETVADMVMFFSRTHRNGQAHTISFAGHIYRWTGFQPANKEAP